MSSSTLAKNYIDLIASGDKKKILCVLGVAGSAAAVSGMAAGAFFAPAEVVPGPGTAIHGGATAIGAVLGALFSGAKAYKVCGGESTQGSYDNIGKSVSYRENVIKEFELNAMKEYGLTSERARQLTKAAVVYASTLPKNAVVPQVSVYEKKKAVAQLLSKMSAQGIA